MTKLTETALAVMPLEDTIKVALPENIFDAGVEEIRAAIESVYAESEAPAILAAILKKQLPSNDVNTASGRKVIASFDDKARSFRVKVEKIGDEIKADADTYVKKVTAAKKGFTADIQAVIDAYFKPLKEFREAEAQREKDRERITSTIARLGTPVYGDTSADIIERLKTLEDMAGEISEEVFGEKEPEATTLLTDTLAALRTHRDFVINQEAEAQRVAKEREELERLRKEKADQEAREAEEKRLAQIKEDARIEAEKESQRKIDEATAQAVQAERERLEVEHQEALRQARDRQEAHLGAREGPLAARQRLSRAKG